MKHLKVVFFLGAIVLIALLIFTLNKGVEAEQVGTLATKEFLGIKLLDIFFGAVALALVGILAGCFVSGWKDRRKPDAGSSNQAAVERKPLVDGRTFCPACGAQCSEDAAFCGRCGSALSPGERPQREAVREQVGRTTKPPGLVLVVIYTALWALLHGIFGILGMIALSAGASRAVVVGSTLICVLSGVLGLAACYGLWVEQKWGSQLAVALYWASIIIYAGPDILVLLFGPSVPIPAELRTFTAAGSAGSKVLTGFILLGNLMAIAYLSSAPQKRFTT